MNEDLNQVEQIDSVLDNISQVDSELGEVVVISSNFIYSQIIAQADWTASGNQFYYTIPQTTHTLFNPCVILFNVNNGTDYENAFVKYTVDANNAITFIVDERVDAKIKLEGEKTNG